MTFDPCAVAVLGVAGWLAITAAAIALARSAAIADRRARRAAAIARARGRHPAGSQLRPSRPRQNVRLTSIKDETKD